MATPSDQEFLNRFRQGFGEWGYDPATVDLVLRMFLAVFAIAALFALWALARRFWGDRVRQTALSPDMARRTLEQALEERARCDLVFSGAGGAKRRTTCAFVDVDLDRLTLEPLNLGEASTRWVGRQAECQFKLRDPNSAAGSRFFTFTASVSGVDMRSDGSALVALTRPETFVETQRRSTMRISASHRHVREAYLCAESAFVWPLATAFLSSTEPPLKLGDQRGAAGRLLNISGGGARLELNRSVYKRREGSFGQDSPHVLVLNLHDPEKNEDLQFILLARIRNSYEDSRSGRVEIGLQFTKRGHPPASQGGEVVWLGIKDGVVLELDQWVLKRHLEGSRPRRP